ncbi:MAG: DUF2236 domain-containing protein [Gemmatimonadales bacterium]|nr:DUF2236 domain-containing protein [Gemmatimonadales bacterium]MYG50273.1 DUF2236 domain-containing protein [Gemmatimonadales bacterium]MYK01119.1 DUF2236 domain-containing protein [Candidatus Palauibacter ramosifaciens]
MTETTIPAAYRPGYLRAAAHDPDLASLYVGNTLISDPVGDAAVDSLRTCAPDTVNALINAGMERDWDTLRRGPKPLQDFFGELESPPDWYRPEEYRAGIAAFHEHSDLFVPAFIIATLLNFSSLISKAFCMTRRVTTKHGLRRIRQNTRHLLEVMLPGALERHGEGWKLSVRIRLVHAQVRRLIRDSGDWDETVYGVPLSAAHMGFASANFSATMLRYVNQLGARLESEERESFMQVWRYASWLSGTPGALLFEGDEARTARLSLVAAACEPRPAREPALISHAVIKAVPDVAELKDPAARRAMVRHGYAVSRALLGREVADRLSFPRQPTLGLLAWLRCKRGIYRRLSRVAPGAARRWRMDQFVLLLDASMIEGITYHLPDQLDALKATPW